MFSPTTLTERLAGLLVMQSTKSTHLLTPRQQKYLFPSQINVNTIILIFVLTIF